MKRRGFKSSARRSSTPGCRQLASSTTTPARVSAEGKSRLTISATAEPSRLECRRTDTYRTREDRPRRTCRPQSRCRNGWRARQRRTRERSRSDQASRCRSRAPTGARIRAQPSDALAVPPVVGPHTEYHGSHLNVELENRSSPAASIEIGAMPGEWFNPASHEARR